jgi:hypothetical protein
MNNMRATRQATIVGYPGLKNATGTIENLGDEPLTNITFEWSSTLPGIEFVQN